MYFNCSKLTSDGDALVAFFHAQRTGGSAFKRFLKKNVGDDNVYAEQTVDDYKHWKSLSARDLALYKVYAGHADYRKRRFNRRPLLLVTLLRDPVYRAASLHQYCQNKEGHVLRGLALETDMLSFYRQGAALKPKYFLNMQCSRVCGKASAKKAIKLIESDYFAVGETSQLAPFADEWARIMGWKKQPISAQVPDAERYKPIITDEFREEVLSGNDEDVALYRYMKDRYFDS